MKQKLSRNYTSVEDMKKFVWHPVFSELVCKEPKFIKWKYYINEIHSWIIFFIFLGNFVCEYCHLPFVSKAKFLRHRRIHTEENPYECVHCHQSFSHHIDLRNHRNEHHMTNKTFKCNFCPKTFSAVSYTHLTLPTIYSV